MNKIVYILIMIFLSSCAEFVISDATYKRPYSLKFIDFYDDNNNIWDAKLENAFKSLDDKYNLNFGSIAKNITAVFSITYNGSILFDSAPLVFETIGLSQHYVLNANECSIKKLEKGETCYFKIKYKYSKETDLNNLDYLNIIIKDSLNSSIIEENIFFIDIKGHRKVIGDISIDKYSLDFGEHDFNIEPEAQIINISYSGEFDIKSINYELIGSDSLKNLFSVDEHTCSNNTTCEAKIKFKALTGSGSAYGEDAVKLIYKVKLENNEIIELSPIVLEGKRRTETNLLVLDDEDKQVFSFDIDEINNSKTLFVKNIGETKTNNFTFSLTNTQDFKIDDDTTCELSSVLNKGETCSIVIKLTKTDPNYGNYTGSINIYSDRIGSKFVNFTGRVYEPATLNIIGSNSLGTIVVGQTSSNIYEIKQSSGDLDSTINGFNFSNNNFILDETYLNSNKCEIGLKLENNSSCFIKVLFSSSIEGSFSSNIVLAYNDGKTNTNANKELNADVILDASLLSLNQNIEFNTIFYDETSSIILLVQNNSNISFNTVNTFGSNEPVEININSLNFLNANSAFEILNENCTKSSNNIILPSQTCEIEIVFNPNQNIGSFSNQLIINFDRVVGASQDLTISSINGISKLPAFITINPSEIYFGTLRFNIDEPIEKEFTVLNTGSETALNIVSTLKNNQDLAFLITEFCSESLEPGSICTIKVKFNPGISLNKLVSSNLELEYIDRDGGNIKSTESVLSATAVSFADLTFNFNNINFGETLINTTKEEILTINNIGYAHANITSFNKTSESISFSIQGLDSPCYENMTLDILETCSIKVIFSPSNFYDLSLNDSLSISYISNEEMFTSTMVTLDANVLVPTELEINSLSNLSEVYKDIEEGSESIYASFEIKLSRGTFEQNEPIISNINLSDTDNFTLDSNDCINHVFNNDNLVCIVYVKFNPQLIQGPNGNINFNSVLSITYDKAYNQGYEDVYFEINANSIASNASLSTSNNLLIFNNPVIRGGISEETLLINLSHESGNHNAVIKNIIFSANFIKDDSASDCFEGLAISNTETCTIAVKFNPGFNIAQGLVNEVLTIKYDTRSNNNLISEINISLRATASLEAIIQIEDINFGNITQGNSKDAVLSLKLLQGFSPSLINQSIIKQDVLCVDGDPTTNDIVASFDININSQLSACNLENPEDMCNINLKILNIPLTDEISAQCIGRYDTLIGQYRLFYYNGLEEVFVTALLSGKSLTPAKIVFHQQAGAGVYTKNLDEYLCYNYLNPYNNGEAICQTDIFNNNPDDLIYNGVLISNGHNRSYSPIQTSAIFLKIKNIGETQARINEEYLNDNPFRFNLGFGAAKYITLNQNYDRAVLEIRFEPTNNNYYAEGGHRGFGEYEAGIRYQNGVITNGVPVVVNTKNDISISEAQKKLVISVSGLKKASLKIKEIDIDGSFIDCENNGTNCKFNKGNDIVYYRDDYNNFVIKDNLNTSQIFALVYEDGDVPARIEDPENNSSMLGGFYYKDFEYGTNSDCQVGDYIFSESTSNLKNYCLIDVSFRYYDINSTYCGFSTTKKDLYVYSSYVWRIMNFAKVKSDSKNQNISAGIRPVLSFEGANKYCTVDFGNNNSTLDLVLKNYSESDIISINLNNFNSYYESNTSKGTTQNDFIINSNTCFENLSADDTCQINITFNRNVEDNGHAKFSYYNYRIPYSILSFLNNFDIETYAETFNSQPTTSTNSLKTTKYGSNISSIASYYCFDCDNNSIDIELSNNTSVPLVFLSSVIAIRRNWEFDLNNNSLFNYSILGSPYTTYNLNPPPYFIDGQIDYSLKVKNLNTFLNSLASYTFDFNHSFNNFYSFSNTNKTYQFKLTYSSAYDVLNFYKGEAQDYLLAEGNLINSEGLNSFIISRTQLISMCQIMNYKLFNPSGDLYNEVDKQNKYLTQDFKDDCCQEDLGIAGSLNELWGCGQ